MKKYLLSFIALATLSFNAQAQQFVNTGGGNKHVILEEFTGIKCSNCPAGHTEATTIVNANPGKVHVVALPPTNSSYTNPSGTAGTDFRRSFADAFYTASYCSPGNSSRFMPSAFVNRKIGTDGNLLHGRTAWSGAVTAALAEPADVNVAVKSEYNTTAQTLTVDVQTYFINAVSNNVALYVMLVEDDLTSDYQSGSSATANNPYIYKHTFRENISTGQWGDAMSGTTTQGTFDSKQYVFNLTTATDPIDVSKAHVVAYLVDATSTNKEVLNGIGVLADGGQATTGSSATAINDLSKEGNVQVYPNPTSSDVFITMNKEINGVEIEVTNILGKTIYQSQIESNQINKIDRNIFPSSGVYFIKLSDNNSAITKKVIIQ